MEADASPRDRNEVAECSGTEHLRRTADEDAELARRKAVWVLPELVGMIAVPLCRTINRTPFMASPIQVRPITPADIRPGGGCIREGLDRARFPIAAGPACGLSIADYAPGRERFKGQPSASAAPAAVHSLRSGAGSAPADTPSLSSGIETSIPAGPINRRRKPQ